MRGYVSIDIETTGIDDKSHILQISAVYDDLKSPITELKTIDLPIKWGVMTHCEPYAIGMNAKLFENMMKKDFKTYAPKEAATELINFLRKVQELEGPDSKGKPQKIILSGKNVASFDIPKIKLFLEALDKESYPNNTGRLFGELVHYKTLDVGSLYYDTFKDNVSLSEINKLTNRAAVSHNALDDAFDVVHAVRYKLGVSRE